MSDMELIHFTALKEFATRGDVERGVRYLHCHDTRNDPYRFTGTAQCHEILTASHVVPKSTSVWSIDGVETSYDRILPMFATYKRNPLFGWLGRDPRPFVVRWEAAADNGLSEAPGVEGHVSSNYLLNINALLREGIIIDTMRIPRKEAR